MCVKSPRAVPAGALRLVQLDRIVWGEGRGIIEHPGPLGWGFMHVLQPCALKALCATHMALQG